MKPSTTTAVDLHAQPRPSPWHAHAAPLLVAGALIAAIAAASWFLTERGSVVRSAHDVGLPLAVQSFPNDWTGSQMRVETQLAWFNVGGSMRIDKQLPMTLETRANGDQWLCQDRPKRCARLLGPRSEE